MAFNNRRRDRGAEIYDLLMAMRFEREKGAQSQLWTVICTRASAFRDSDNNLRDGRKSWISIENALRVLPVARTEKAGDGR